MQLRTSICLRIMKLEKLEAKQISLKDLLCGYLDNDKYNDLKKKNGNCIKRILP